MTRAMLRRCLLAALALVASAVAATAASGATQASPKLRLHAVPATVQFMNHADDRLRGMSTNPFNQKAEAVIIEASGDEKKFGPFPGDDILYGFKLFSDAKLTKPAGSALFTCYYQFAKRATCDSYFDLTSGLVLASGQVPFGQTRFKLGIMGGTRSYFGALGEVDSAPGAGNTQRFDVTMTGLTR